MKRRISLGLVAALAMVMVWGCAPHLAPTLPAGIALQPGRYVTSSYRAPNFAANRTVYTLGEFPVQGAQGVAPETFQAQLQEALSLAFKENGLKLESGGDTVLSGKVQQIEIRGAAYRFVTGKITAYLTVEGRISRGEDTIFAFQDQIRLTSPLNPGPPAPKERDLLLNQAARTCASHLVNELLLYWPEEEGK